MPSMDSQNPSRRFRSVPASHPPPPQASSDRSSPENRRDSPGSDSGTFGGLGVVRQPQRGQEPQPSQSIPGANEFPQNPGFNDFERGDNAYATIRARRAQHGAAGAVVAAQAPQFAQESGHGQLQHAFTDHGAPALSLSLSTASPQLPGTRSSDSRSPAGSVGSQLSHHSGGGGHQSPGDASHVSYSAGYTHRAYGLQTGSAIHVQGAHNASPQSFSPGIPHGAYSLPVGFEQAGLGNVAYGMHRGGPSSPQVRRLASTGIVAGSPPQNVFEVPRHIQGGDPHAHPQAPSHPQTPQLDFRTGQLSLEDSPVQYAGHLQPQQQPYGVPMPAPPPAPMGPPGAENVQQRQLPLTHIAAANLGEHLTLDMLSDSVIPGEKPNYPYPTLIRAAILGSPRRALTLQGIYSALEDRFEWFRTHRNDKAWQNSIRHNLSLNKLFRRVAKPITEPGKGSYWTVDFAAGEGNKRERKRTKHSGREQHKPEGDAPSTSQQTLENISSSDDEGDPLFVGTSQSQNQPPSPFLGGPIYDEPHIDPALLSQGHIVEQGPIAPPRSPRPGPAPYARPAFPMSVPASAIQDPRFSGQFSVRPGQTTTFGTPSFDQPQFGQGPLGLDVWEASFMGPPTWGTPPAPSPFDIPFAPAGPAPNVGHQMPGRAHPVRAMTSPSVATAGPSGTNTPVYHHGSLAASAETVSSAAGTSSSSASEAGSVRNVAGPSVPQTYKRGSGSSSSSSQE